MKVKKNKSKQLSISEVNVNHVIVVKHNDRWCIMQANEFNAIGYRLLVLDSCYEGNSLTVNNGYDSSEDSIKYWFKECQEMHAFETTKEAFKFLIKVL